MTTDAYVNEAGNATNATEETDVVVAVAHVEAETVVVTEDIHEAVVDAGVGRGVHPGE